MAQRQSTRTELTEEQVQRVVRALVTEYRWMGVTAQSASREVRKGGWDDHPARGAR